MVIIFIFDFSLGFVVLEEFVILGEFILIFIFKFWVFFFLLRFLLVDDLLVLGDDLFVWLDFIYLVGKFGMGGIFIFCFNFMLILLIVEEVEVWCWWEGSCFFGWLVGDDMDIEWLVLVKLFLLEFVVILVLVWGVIGVEIFWLSGLCFIVGVCSWFGVGVFFIFFFCLDEVIGGICVIEFIEFDLGKEGNEGIEVEDGGRVDKVVGGVVDILSVESDFSCCFWWLSLGWFGFGEEFWFWIWDCIWVCCFWVWVVLVVVWVWIWVVVWVCVVVDICICICVWVWVWVCVVWVCVWVWVWSWVVFCLVDKVWFFVIVVFVLVGNLWGCIVKLLFFDFVVDMGLIGLLLGLKLLGVLRYVYWRRKGLC